MRGTLWNWLISVKTEYHINKYSQSLGARNESTTDGSDHMAQLILRLNLY